jgi:dTDP-4-dehydrorhamnose 3,5-epimerase
MEIRVEPTRLDGVVVVETDFVRDERGFFVETWHARRFAEHGLAYEFVQDNHSRSGRGVLRGIHYQDLTAPMTKLVRCTAGCVFDAVVDLRVGSPTFAQWIGVDLSAANMRQLLVPVGFGHAFLTLTDGAEVQYKCTNYYTPAAEAGLAWNDPDIGIEWPIGAAPILSPRDRRAPSLAQYLRQPVFTYPAPDARPR